MIMYAATDITKILFPVSAYSIVTQNYTFIQEINWLYIETVKSWLNSFLFFSFMKIKVPHVVAYW